MPERRIELSGCYNFRDIGGYRTRDGRQLRWGTIFRSDNLSHLAPRAHAAFNALGLRTLIDLRTPDERRRHPHALPAGHTVRIVELPISLAPELEDKTGGWAKLKFLASGGLRKFDSNFALELYRRAPDNAAAVLARVFELLSDAANRPALISCMGGKDRTGFTVAMLLHALGVEPGDIMHDYTLTNLYAAEAFDRMVRQVRWMSLFRIPAENVRMFTRARPEYLGAALDQIDARYGGVEAYLEQRAGLTPTLRERLRQALLLPGSDA